MCKHGSDCCYALAIVFHVVVVDHQLDSGSIVNVFGRFDLAALCGCHTLCCLSVVACILFDVVVYGWVRSNFCWGVRLAPLSCYLA